MVPDDSVAEENKQDIEPFWCSSTDFLGSSTSERVCYLVLLSALDVGGDVVRRESCSSAYSESKSLCQRHHPISLKSRRQESCPEATPAPLLPPGFAPLTCNKQPSFKQSLGRSDEGHQNE